MSLAQHHQAALTLLFKVQASLQANLRDGVVGDSVVL